MGTFSSFFLPSFLIPTPQSFVAIFVFWRLAYNIGLGYLLWRQSQTRFLTKFFAAKGKNMPEQVKRILATSMGKDYRYDVRFLT